MTQISVLKQAWEYFASGIHLLKETIFKGWIPSDYLGKLPSDIQAFKADKWSFKIRSKGEKVKRNWFNVQAH